MMARAEVSARRRKPIPSVHSLLLLSRGARTLSPRPGLSGQNPRYPLHRPVDFFTCDHQRGGETDNVDVGLLAEEALLLECLAETPCASCVGREFDTDP